LKNLENQIIFININLSTGIGDVLLKFGSFRITEIIKEILIVSIIVEHLKL
jgi:hypothetical protein